MILLNESGSLWRNWDCICYCWEKKVKHLILICMPATHSFEFLFMFRSFHSSWLFEENNKTQLSHKMWVSTTSFFNSSLHHRLLIFFLLFPFSIFLFTFDAHESEFFKHFSCMNYRGLYFSDANELISPNAFIRQSTLQSINRQPTVKQFSSGSLLKKSFVVFFIMKS